MDKSDAVIKRKNDSEIFSEHIMMCLLAFISYDSVLLTQNSANFLIGIEYLWEKNDISSQDIKRELMARIDLSDDLLRRKIRARKGGQYRSTKLP